MKILLASFIHSFIAICEYQKWKWKEKQKQNKEPDVQCSLFDGGFIKTEDNMTTYNVYMPLLNPMTTIA